VENQGERMAGAIYPDLAGKSVLVTGGGSGIGASIVKGFARQGCKVGFIDIADAPSRALVEEIRAAGGTVHYVHADLRDIAALRAAIGEVRTANGPISVLVNNAAHDERHATEDVTPDYFDDRVAVNLKHQFFASQAVLPDMKAAGGGSIICFGSMSWMAGMGNMAIYTACKSAVLGLVRSLARDFGPYGIRVNSIAPGWIMTERQLTLWLTPEADEMRRQAQCIERRLVPEDIAKFTVFLSSDEASACTNQSYVVDGGWV
jgi:NAD(P)-dependent dehydrogenase (short-subunit alcohol dehydrogenase family)